MLFFCCVFWYDFRMKCVFRVWLLSFRFSLSRFLCCRFSNWVVTPTLFTVIWMSKTRKIHKNRLFAAYTHAYNTSPNRTHRMHFGNRQNTNIQRIEIEWKKKTHSTDYRKGQPKIRKKTTHNQNRMTTSTTIKTRKIWEKKKRKNDENSQISEWIKWNRRNVSFWAFEK